MITVQAVQRNIGTIYSVVKLKTCINLFWKADIMLLVDTKKPYFSSHQMLEKSFLLQNVV